MLLFEFNDVFAKFSDAIQAKFGKRPDQMTETEYNDAVSSLVRTDFYEKLAIEVLGWDMMKWGMTYRDREVGFILVNEVKSPSWVNNQKIAYMDKVCAEMGIVRLDFWTCRDLNELKGHAYRCPLISRNEKHRQAWDSAGKYRSVFLNDDINITIQDVNRAFSDYTP